MPIAMILLSLDMVHRARGKPSERNRAEHARPSPGEAGAADSVKRRGEGGGQQFSIE